MNSTITVVEQVIAMPLRITLPPAAHRFGLLSSSYHPTAFPSELHRAVTGKVRSSSSQPIKEG